MKGPPLWDVAVVGGGLAGSAAAIRLARAGRRVALIERDAGVGRKLCGEFLSPNAVASLTALGVERELAARGAVVVRSWSVASQRAEFVAPFASPGYAIPRSTLDPFLREVARRAGAHVLEGTRVTRAEQCSRGILLRIAGEKEVDREDSLEASAVVVACGRAAKISGLTDPLEEPVRASASSTRKPGEYLAMKAHLRTIQEGDFPSRVALFGLRGAYVGVVPIGGGLVNVCVLVTREAFQGCRSGVELLAREARWSKTWESCWRRLCGGTDAAWVVVSALDFRRRRWTLERGVFAGDAAALAPPLLGEGMAIALESGRLAADCVEKALLGEAGNAQRLETSKEIARRFAARLSWGRSLQSVLLGPAATTGAVLALRACPGLASWIRDRLDVPNRAGIEPGPILVSD